MTLTLRTAIPKLLQSTRARDDGALEHGSVAKGSQVREILEETVVFKIMISAGPHGDLDLEDENPTFMRGALGHDHALPCQVCLQTFQWFRRYLLCVTDGQPDPQIPSPH